MSFQRPQLATLVARLREIPSRILIVSGPRQVGKTTLVRQALQMLSGEQLGLYRAADDPLPDSSPFYDSTITRSRVLGAAPDQAWLIEQWQGARARQQSSGRSVILVLDEIQKIPNWSELVKGLWDADRRSGGRLHVVLLGSSPLLMQQGLTESLAGRYELIHLTHWSLSEMNEAFGMDLEHYVYFGGYPGSTPLIEDEMRWREYILAGLVEPNIDRDILQMTRVDKPALLRRLFELGCAYSGQILSYTKMQGQLQDAGNTTTLAHYLDLLGRAGLLAGLHKYAGQAHRKRASSPKLAVLNTALMSAGSDYNFAQARADRSFWGRLVESAVGAHLYNTRPRDCRLYYWRRSAYEVDFILERGEKRLAIEVKSGQRRGGVPGLALFEKEFGATECMVVGTGGVPIEEFLSYDVGVWLENQ